MVYCFWCKEKLTPSSDYPVKIPENEFIQTQWLVSMNLDPNLLPDKQNSYLCKDHFEKDDRLLFGSNETKLRYGAVPKIPLMMSDVVCSDARRTVRRIDRRSVDAIQKIQNRNIPSEIVLEILMFNGRDDIEKYQLVSKKWNSTIKGYGQILPLRFFGSLFIPLVDIGMCLYMTTSLSSNQFDVEGPILDSLKFGIFNDIRFPGDVSYHHPDLMDPVAHLEQSKNLLIKHLSPIILTNGQKIRLKKYIAYPYQEKFEFIKLMFEEFFDICEAELYFKNDILQTFLENPTILEVRTMPKKMKICQTNEQNSEFVIDAKMIKDFIQKSLYKGRRYKMHTFEHDPSFAKDYLKMFVKSTSPEDMLRTIRVYYVRYSIKDIYEHVISYLSNYPNVNIFIKPKSDRTYECYEITREDNWTFQCAHSVKDMLLKYKIFQKD